MTGDHRIDEKFACRIGAIGIIHKPFQVVPFSHQYSKISGEKMKKILIILLLAFSFTLGSAEILEYSKLKKGMEGEGKTIFKGTNIETFKFKILGFLKNFSPGKNLIIAELFSPELEGIGVIAGMSGSPVFIDGKIIGSVSYGFNFSKKPIAGITPIEDILKVKDYDTPEYTIDISDIKVQFDNKNITDIKNRLKVEMIPADQSGFRWTMFSRSDSFQQAEGSPARPTPF